MDGKRKINCFESKLGLDEWLEADLILRPSSQMREVRDIGGSKARRLAN